MPLGLDDLNQIHWWVYRRNNSLWECNQHPTCHTMQYPWNSWPDDYTQTKHMRSWITRPKYRSYIVVSITFETPQQALQSQWCTAEPWLLYGHNPTSFPRVIRQLLSLIYFRKALQQSPIIHFNPTPVIFLLQCKFSNFLQEFHCRLSTIWFYEYYLPVRLAWFRTQPRKWRMPYCWQRSDKVRAVPSKEIFREPREICNAGCKNKYACWEWTLLWR